MTHQEESLLGYLSFLECLPEPLRGFSMGSSVRLKVPQWMATEYLARMSLCMRTASSGFTWEAFMNQRGS